MTNRNYWLLMESANFDATVFDSDDLSTIRGASWAMLEFPSLFGPAFAASICGSVEPVYIGGSGGLWAICTSLDLEGLRRRASTFFHFDTAVLEMLKRAAGERLKVIDDDLIEVLPFLVFNHSVVEAAAEGKEAIPNLDALQRAKAFHQYQVMDIDVPEFVAGTDDELFLDLPCVIDRVRPRADNAWRSSPDGGAPLQDVPVSASVAARRTFGRTARRNVFYRLQADYENKKHSFSDSFEDIATSDLVSTRAAGVEGRMAIISIDGNGFGKLRDKFIKADPANGLGEFAREIDSGRRALLKSLTSACAHNAAFLAPSTARNKKRGEAPSNYILRMETLMWGADEGLFVIPAWGVPVFLNAFHEAMQSTAGTVMLPNKTAAEGRADIANITYAVGVLICHYKTPIRMAKRIADDLRDCAKSRWGQLEGRRKALQSDAGTDSVVSMMVLDGMEIPTGGAAAERTAKYGIAEDDQAQSFHVPLSDIPGMFAAFRALKGEPGASETGVSRAGLAGILESAVSKWKSGETVSRDALSAELKKLNDCLRTGKTSPGEPFGEDFFEVSFPWANRAPLAPIIPLLEYWNILPDALDGPHADLPSGASP
jgi:hypothetical protein